MTSPLDGVTWPLLLKVSLIALVEVVGMTVVALRWAVPAKFAAVVLEATKPKFEALDKRCDGFAPLAALLELKERVDGHDRVHAEIARMGEALRQIEANTREMATDMRALSADVQQQGRQLSEVQGAFGSMQGGMPERRSGRDRRGSGA